MKFTCRKSVVEVLTCRRILFGMMITAFIINTILYSIMNITIVSMTDDNGAESLLNWSEEEKQDIIGYFFLGYAGCKIPSGRLAEIIGARKVIGYSILLASVLTILTPTIVQWNYYVLLTSRVVMGILLGPLFPAQLPLAAKWFCVTSQSRFLSSLEATSLGITFTYFLSGFLIDAYGWRSVFYMAGGISLIWSMIWFCLIYDSPEKHPRISDKEKNEIQHEIGVNIIREKISFFAIPWKNIAISTPFWAIVMAQLANYFTIVTLGNIMPSYMDQVLHFDIIRNGLYSSLTQAGKYFAALMFGYAGDSLLKSKKISRNSNRKIFEAIGLLFPALFMMLQVFFGENVTASVTLLTLTITFNAAVVSGHYVNMLDITPNFSGTIAGVAYTFSSLLGFASTKIVALLLQNGHSFQEWLYIFWIIAAINVAGCLVYLLFCSTEVQKWNSFKCDPN